MMLFRTVNHGFKLSRTVMLFFVLCQAADQITKHPQSRSVIAGSTATLTCEFSRPLQFSLEERVIWYKDYQALSLNDKITSFENLFLSVVISKNNKRFDLQISHISSNDSGEYFCYFTLSSVNNIQSESAYLVVDYTTKAIPSVQNTHPDSTYPTTTTDNNDVTNHVRPAAIVISILAVVIAFVLMVIIVSWILNKKKTNDGSYLKNLIMPSSCFKRSHDNEEDAIENAPSSTAFGMNEYDVLGNKNASDLYLISGTPALTNSNKRVQNEYHDINSLRPAAKIKGESSSGMLHSKPMETMKHRKHRNVEGLTYAQLDLQHNPKTHIISDMPTTQYAVIAL